MMVMFMVLMFVVVLLTFRKQCRDSATGFMAEPAAGGCRHLRLTHLLQTIRIANPGGGIHWRLLGAENIHQRRPETDGQAMPFHHHRRVGQSMLMHPGGGSRIAEQHQ